MESSLHTFFERIRFYSNLELLAFWEHLCCMRCNVLAASVNMPRLAREHFHRGTGWFEWEETVLFCHFVGGEAQTPNCHHSSVETATGVLLSQDVVTEWPLRKWGVPGDFHLGSSIPGPLNPFPAMIQTIGRKRLSSSFLEICLYLAVPGL